MRLAFEASSFRTLVVHDSKTMRFDITEMMVLSGDHRVSLLVEGIMGEPYNIGDTFSLELILKNGYRMSNRIDLGTIKHDSFKQFYNPL